MKISTPTQSLEAYISAWNASNADECSGHLITACAADVVLLDPHAERPVHGWGAIASHIAFFRERNPYHMQPTSGIDVHHGICRLHWRFVSGDSVLSTGVLIADAASDGRLQRIVHFVNTPATAPAQN